MSGFFWATFLRRLFFFCACAGLTAAAAQAQASGAVIYQRIDAAVQSRVSHVAGFSDVEKYDVYRGQDESHSVAEITVKMSYRRGVGRSYEILSQGGSEMIRRFGLLPLLKDEDHLSQPGNVERTWFTTANYKMELKSGQVEQLGGHRCYQVAITPRHKAPNAIEGTLWVDATDGSIVKVKGVASRRPSMLAGTTRMMREYTKVHGYAMATHARAVSNSHWIGRTVVTVEYSHYHLVFYGNPASAATTSMASAESD